MPCFKERFPWLGGDLQTLRDTFRQEKLAEDVGKKLKIKIPETPSGICGSGELIAFLDHPKKSLRPHGLVMLVHGLGGSSQRQGLRRMAITLQNQGFATLRINLRGSAPSRMLAPGTYAASCNSDLLPLINTAKELCKEFAEKHPNQRINSRIPLFGVGISLGGTILLNACLNNSIRKNQRAALLDGLICTSSPLDLQACTASIERPRNRIYQAWLVKRLIKQTLSDPFGLKAEEAKTLTSKFFNSYYSSSIRAFDTAITAKRWGYQSVDDYYKRASPIGELFQNPKCMPPTLLIQAKDDPWVPSKPIEDLRKKLSFESQTKLQIILTKHGGHNGFHGIQGCWGDLLVAKWLKQILSP